MTISSSVNADKVTLWKITAYDGTWRKSMHTDVRKAVDYFLEDTVLTVQDIKVIENLSTYN